MSELVCSGQAGEPGAGEESHTEQPTLAGRVRCGRDHSADGYAHTHIHTRTHSHTLVHTQYTCTITKSTRTHTQHTSLYHRQMPTHMHIHTNTHTLIESPNARTNTHAHLGLQHDHRVRLLCKTLVVWSDPVFINDKLMFSSTSNLGWRLDIHVFLVRLCACADTMLATAGPGNHEWFCVDLGQEAVVWTAGFFPSYVRT